MGGISIFENEKDVYQNFFGYTHIENSVPRKHTLKNYHQLKIFLLI